MEQVRRLAVAWDAEHGDKYLAAVLDDSARGHEPKPNPIIRILRILHYPAQRAVAHPEITSRVPPLPEGTICRMALQDKEPDAGWLSLPYAECLRICAETALKEAKSERERELIQETMGGENGHGRAILVLKPWEI